MNYYSHHEFFDLYALHYYNIGSTYSWFYDKFVRKKVIIYSGSRHIRCVGLIHHKNNNENDYVTPIV